MRYRPCEAVAVHKAVSHAQERELAVHRHHGQLRHVLAVRHDDAEPVEPAGYGEALRPGGCVLARRGVPTHGEEQHAAIAHGSG